MMKRWTISLLLAAVTLTGLAAAPRGEQDAFSRVDVWVSGMGYTYTTTAGTATTPYLGFSADAAIQVWRGVYGAARLGTAGATDSAVRVTDVMAGVGYALPLDRFQPYAAFEAGPAFYTEASGTTTRFGWHLDFGVDIRLADHLTLGIKAESTSVSTGSGDLKLLGGGLGLGWTF